MSSSCSHALILIGMATATLVAQEVPSADVATVRIVVPLNNQPADVVESVLKQILQNSLNTRVTSSPLSNLVVVEAPPNELPTILELARQLDRPPAMVMIEAIAIEFDKAATIELPGGATADVNRAIAELEQQQKLRIIDRLQLSTLSNQPAFVQVGQRVPSRTGTQMTGGGSVSTYQFEDVGVLLRCTPRVADDGSVALQFTFEKSALASSIRGDDDEAPPMSAMSSKVESTIRLQGDECVVLGGLRDAADEDGATSLEWRLIISAKANPAR